MPPNDFVQSASRRRLFFGENVTSFCFLLNCLLHYCVTTQMCLKPDSKGNPRNITNSKGKKRIPNSKELSAALKTTDPLFLDFIKRCLAYVLICIKYMHATANRGRLYFFAVFSWDPTKRMTPDEGLQHEWILEGNFNKVRPRAKPVVKKVSDGSNGTENSSSLSFHKQGNNQTGKSGKLIYRVDELCSP